MPVILDGSAGVTTNTGAVYNGLQSQTEVATTSGTAVDFTGIPSWVKRITVMFNGVSTNSNSPYIVQIGTSSGIETTGYNTSGAYIAGINPASTTATAGFLAVSVPAAGNNHSGICQIVLVSPNTWVFSAVVRGGSNMYYGAGDKSLPGTLDRIRITTVTVNTFDAGSVNIIYE